MAEADVCDAYDSFQKRLTEIGSKYDYLNPMKGEVCPKLLERGSDGKLNELGREFIRGGIVAVMAAWDSYVHDLFNEAFDTVITVCSGQEKRFERLIKQWPASSEIIREVIKTHENICEDADLESNKFWIELLNLHRRSIVDQRTLHPIFNFMAAYKEDAMTIDGMFMQLFQHKKQKTSIQQKISYMVLEAADSQPFLLYPGEHEVTLVPTKEGITALHIISRLYYDLRGRVVDGKKKKIFQDTPNDFPKVNFLHTQGDGNVDDREQHYITLYEQVINERNVEVDYMVFLSVVHFISFTAKHLKQAMAKWIYKLQSEDERSPVWGYYVSTASSH